MNPECNLTVRALPHFEVEKTGTPTGDPRLTTEAKLGEIFSKLWQPIRQPIRDKTILKPHQMGASFDEKAQYYQLFRCDYQNCKTFMRRFDPDPRLQFPQQLRATSPSSFLPWQPIGDRPLTNQPHETGNLSPSCPPIISAAEASRTCA